MNILRGSGDRYINYRTWICYACSAINDHKDAECQFCDADHTCFVRGSSPVHKEVPPNCDACGKSMVDYWKDL